MPATEECQAVTISPMNLVVRVRLIIESDAKKFPLSRWEGLHAFVLQLVKLKVTWQRTQKSCRMEYSSRS